MQTQSLDKPIAVALRPDRSRVVIGTTNHGEDVVLYVSPERPDAWRRGEFARLVGEFKGRGIKVLVSCGDDLQVV